MGLDTKYRPHNFEDVLGQESTIKVIKRFVSTGRGFQQSYLFCGPYGSGKTTLGRILARALLCDHPVEGAPCDNCPSCHSMLEGSQGAFIEVDAATNSGKSEVKKIIADLEYSNFSGKKTLYLFDESHQLSKDALDALLKPLEENVQGSEDKRLVCIFCTTEPEKMRATILSRCAPAFVIHPLSPEVIAKRLAYVCEKERISYEPDILPLIAEITECHIRDALKAIEGVSMLGEVDRENVNKYLHLDLNSLYLDILSFLGSDLEKALLSVKNLFNRTSPSVCYERLANAALFAYKVSLGLDTPPVYWDAARLSEIGRQHGNHLVGLVSLFAQKPRSATEDMVICDLISQHLSFTGQLTTPSFSYGSSERSQKKISSPIKVSRSPSQKNETNLNNSTHNLTADGNNNCAAALPSSMDLCGVHIDRRAINGTSTGKDQLKQSKELSPAEFGRLFGIYLLELRDIGYNGLQRQNNVGDS